MKQFLLVLAAFAGLASANAQIAAKSYEFKNGAWFTGTGFETATWYTVNGVFSKKAPLKIDSTIDLSGKWIVPPMADAFCTSIVDQGAAPKLIQATFDEGIFYLRLAGNTQEGRAVVEPLLNKSNAPDAIFSNGALTCSLGYPFVQFEGPAQGLRNPQQWGQQYDKIKSGRKQLGNGYWFVDNKEALTANWPKILAQKPGYIFIYLLDAANQGGKEGKGLSADMAKAIVKKAHKAGIQALAFVETAADARLALKIGADGLANLPGYNWDGSGDLKNLELTLDDFKKMAKKKMFVTPLFAANQGNIGKAAVLNFQTQTFERIMASGVSMVMGSNDPSRTSRVELGYWFNIGKNNYLKLIRAACETSPQSIFPKRKIGKIENGYEASFLVLDQDPSQNLLILRMISMKVKNGIILPAAGRK